jgi:hypothetical protein
MVRTVLALVLVLAAGCTRRPSERAHPALPADLPLTVLADTAELRTLPAGAMPPAPVATARAALTQVAPSRAALEAPLPEALPAEPPPAPAAERGRDALLLDDELRPPIARGPTPFVVRGTRRGWVELDVRVGEDGMVTDAECIAHDADSVTVAAAVEAALATRYWPAVRRGVAVAVWCRQRYEVRR